MFEARSIMIKNWYEDWRPVENGYEDRSLLCPPVFSMSFSSMSQGFGFYSFSIFYVRIYKTGWRITFILSIFTEPEHMKFPGREAL